jgi:predicted molibdopterin-dependent oxidoreductase YjgC
MFRRIENGGDEVVEILLDGEAVSVPAGMTVAAVLLMLDRIPTRTHPVTGTPRAPHCLMGACFECLLEIDGIEQRACQVVVSAGMQIARRLEPNNKGAAT